MAIDKNSTGYTFLFSIAMVVVVGTARVYRLSLKDRQDANAADKKMMDILAPSVFPLTEPTRPPVCRVRRGACCHRFGWSPYRQLQLRSTQRTSGPLKHRRKEGLPSSIKSAVKAADGDEAALAAALSDKDLQFRTDA